MAYNNGREDRKWRIWKEAEEKVLREHGVDEASLVHPYSVWNGAKECSNTALCPSVNRYAGFSL